MHLFWKSFKKLLTKSGKESILSASQRECWGVGKWYANSFWYCRLKVRVLPPHPLLLLSNHQHLKRFSAHSHCHVLYYYHVLYPLYHSLIPALHGALHDIGDDLFALGNVHQYDYTVLLHVVDQ